MTDTCEGCGLAPHDDDCDLIAMLKHGITLARDLANECLKDDTENATGGHNTKGNLEP
jgi:hypothetical protein